MGQKAAVVLRVGRMGRSPPGAGHRGSEMDGGRWPKSSLSSGGLPVRRLPGSSRALYRPLFGPERGEMFRTPTSELKLTLFTRAASSPVVDAPVNGTKLVLRTISCDAALVRSKKFESCIWSVSDTARASTVACCFVASLSSTRLEDNLVRCSFGEVQKIRLGHRGRRNAVDG